MWQITCPVCKTSPESTLQAFPIYVCNGCGNRWTFISEEINGESLYLDEIYTVVDNRKSIFEWVIFREARKVLRKANTILVLFGKSEIMGFYLKSNG